MLVTMFMIKNILGLQGHISKIPPTNIDDYTKNKFMNMQRENLIPQRNIKNNDKKTDEIYQKNLIDDKESDELYQISKNDEEKNLRYRNHETEKFEFTEKQKILRNNLMK